MRFTLQMGGRQVLVLSRDRFIEFDTLSRAAEWVADYIVHPVNLFTLRAALAADDTFGELLRLDLADLVVELGRMLSLGQLKGLLGPREQNPWRWRLPETPTFDISDGWQEAEKNSLTGEDEEGEEDEDEYEETKPEPVIPPEFPRLAKREADAVDFSARKMGTQLDLMRYVGEKEVPTSAVAETYPALASQQAGALDEAVGNAAVTLNALAGGTVQKHKSAVAEAMPQMAAAAGDAVKTSANGLDKHVGSLTSGKPFDRPDSDVAPAVGELAARQGSSIRDQATEAGKTLDGFAGPEGDMPGPGTIGPAFVTEAQSQGTALASSAESVGGGLDKLNQGEIEAPPQSETKSVFHEAAHSQSTAITDATQKAGEVLDGIASTLDERAPDPGKSTNAPIFRADSAAAGSNISEAADRTSKTLDDLRPVDPKAEAAKAVQSGGGPTIRLEGPAGMSMQGMMVKVRFGGQEMVFLSDAEGVVRLTGVPEEGYDILGIEDSAGLEVVDVRSSAMPPPPKPEEPTT